LEHWVALLKAIVEADAQMVTKAGLDALTVLSPPNLDRKRAAKEIRGLVKYFDRLCCADAHAPRLSELCSRLHKQGELLTKLESLAREDETVLRSLSGEAGVDYRAYTRELSRARNAIETLIQKWPKKNIARKAARLLWRQPEVLLANDCYEVFVEYNGAIDTKDKRARFCQFLKIVVKMSRGSVSETVEDIADQCQRYWAYVSPRRQRELALQFRLDDLSLSESDRKALEAEQDQVSGELANYKPKYRF
jgi:hypothetical protein